MKCHNCGFELPDGAKFCKNCGHAQIPVPVSNVPTPTQGSATVQQSVTAEPKECPAKKPRSLMPLIIGLGIIALALIIAVVIVAAGRMKHDAESPSATEVVSTGTQPTVTEEAVITELPVATTEVPTEELAAEPTGAPTSQDTEPVPDALGKGSVVYKNMTCSYRQTGETIVELTFNNEGPYKFEFWKQSHSDRGFTVSAIDEFGNRESVICEEWGSDAKFKAYCEEKTALIEFNQLSGKITEVKILGVHYDNTEEFDFNYREAITITSD